MKAILGRKIGMTQIFKDDRVVPVTVVKAGPCVITQVKTKETDGYWAVQMGLLERVKENAINQPLKGHLKKAGNPPTRVLREFRLNKEPEASVGDTITVEVFQENDVIDIVGVSKGKGFQGVVRRHGFRGGAASHGSMFHRAPGSIGQSAFPSRVWKGLRMPGRMGGKRITVKNAKVVHVDADKGLLFVKGAVPGSRGSLVMIKPAKRG